MPNTWTVFKSVPVLAALPACVGQSEGNKGTGAYLSIMTRQQLGFTVFLSDGMRQYLHTPIAREC